MMRKFKFLKPLVIFILAALVITTVSRVILVALYYGRVSEVESWWSLFSIGLRFDLIMIAYLSFIPTLLIFTIPDRFSKFTNSFLKIYFVTALLLFFFMEATSFDFIGEYDTRPNKIFIEYLIYPKEVATMLVKGRLLSVLGVLVASIAMIYLGFRFGGKLFRSYPSKYLYRIALFPLVGFLLFWAARGSLTSRRPFNPSNAVFSNDQLTNSLAMNSLYTVFYAAYSMKHEVDAMKIYGTMDVEEALERVKKYSTATPEDYLNPDLPLLHRQTPDSILNRPYNLVIFLQESLGADYVGALGGMPLTPELDKLAKEGLLWSNLYCTGTRSVRGIEAVVTGFLPSPSESVVKLSGAQTGFFTLASLLKERGYDTSFLYGGMANFDNMGSFFNGNGFDNIIDETVMNNDGNQYAMKGTWGYSDEDLAMKANEYFSSLGSKPFFSLIFSSSNHDPFEFPDNRIELYEEPKNSVHNAIKYADYAIGKFMEMARGEKYFENTVFIIVADHNTRTYGKNLVPINKFRIPALIIGPTVPQDSIYSKLSSQIDLPPTLLSYLGMEADTPMPGRDITKLADSVKGRAIMQFHDINAFRVENQVIIMQPYKEPLQFHMESDTTLVPVPIDPELARDAKAHVVLSGYLYRDRKYRTK